MSERVVSKKSKPGMTKKRREKKRNKLWKKRITNTHKKTSDWEKEGGSGGRREEGK